MKLFLFATLMLVVNARSILTSINNDDARIVNGAEANRGDFPYMASIEGSASAGLPGTWSHYCGGVIVDERWILTAAHCVPHETAVFKGRIVIAQHDTAHESGKERYHSIERSYTHPDYKLTVFGNSVNDLALIKLKTKIQFDQLAKSVELPTKVVVTTGQTATLSGWGNTQGSATNPSVLQHFSDDIPSQSTCQEAWGSLIYDRETMLCFGGGTHSACGGDSGSPLVIQRIDHAVVVVGLVSFGDSSDCLSVPGVFTRVSNYIEWINETMKK